MRLFPVALGLLRIVVEDISDDLTDTLGSMQGRILLNTPNGSIGYLGLGLHGRDIIHVEAEDIAVVDGVDDGVNYHNKANGFNLFF